MVLFAPNTSFITVQPGTSVHHWLILVYTPLCYKKCYSSFSTSCCPLVMFDQDFSVAVDLNRTCGVVFTCILAGVKMTYVPTVQKCVLVVESNYAHVDFSCLRATTEK